MKMKERIHTSSLVEPNSSSSVAVRSKATRNRSRTFSSNALWCSNRDLRAFKTSTSEETPALLAACRLTTVIRNDRSWRETRHSKCSSKS